MKDPNGFDELARRKLAERDFAFDPSHWADMERLLAERERKPKAWWPWMAAGVLLLSGAAVWSVMSEEAAAGPTSSGPVVERVEQPTTITEPVRTTQAPTPTQASRAVAEEPEKLTASPVSGTGTPEVQAASITTSTARKSSPARTTKARETADPVRDENDAPASTSAVDRGKSLPITATLTGSTLADDAPTPNAAEKGNGTKGATNEPPASAIPTPSSWQGTGTATAEVAEPAAPTVDLSQHEISAPVQEPLENTAPDPSDHSADAPDPNASGTETPAPGLLEPSAAPPAPPAWLAVRTPFELSLLGGGSSTTSDYRGSGTENWGASTQRQNTSGFGLEGVWNIGAHFGLGIGMHYSSYKERLLTEESSRTDRTLTNSYFWTAHDTMVLTVTGTDTIGAVVYNITELVPITINELGVDTDTSYSTTVLRERRTVMNTLNYVEIPLLLDAHTDRGRWVFGVRGGPTLGLLTSKQGSIPGDGEAGYVDLDERTFSSVTLGCMARAYARYRLNSSWAIGLEPTWRQQLGNAFGDADVQRRSNAFGGYVSLSYRFAPQTVVP